jgi:hypothetical protein
MQLRTACLHEHCRTWPVCDDCAEALALRLRSRPAQCPLCLVLAAEGHKGCPVTVLIRPLGLVRP